jgi:hypothetical protein
MLVAVLSIYCALAFSSKPAIAADTAPTADIEDVLATHHFISFDDLYTNGTDPLLCVETESHKYALWNPVSDTLSQESDEKCKPSSSLKEFHTMISWRPLQGVPKSLAQHDTSFSEASEIYFVVDGGSPHCGSGDAYYTITFLDGSLYSFYFVVRLIKPREATINTMCEYAWDDPRKSYQESYTSETIHSVDIGNGRTLMYAYGRRVADYPSVLMIVKRMPNASIWVSQTKDAFIIPKFMLSPLLEKAGAHPADRQAAVATLLDKLVSP